jgi:hypothetical protein
LLLTRGVSTRTAAISSSSIHRATSMSCTVVSVMIISLVKKSGTDGLRCAACMSSGAPISRLVTTSFMARYCRS